MTSSYFPASKSSLSRPWCQEGGQCSLVARQSTCPAVYLSRCFSDHPPLTCVPQNLLPPYFTLLLCCGCKILLHSSTSCCIHSSHQKNVSDGLSSMLAVRSSSLSYTHTWTHARTHARAHMHHCLPTSCFIWKFCTRLRSVNIRIVHSAVSRSDSSKSLKLKSVILRVWADGTTAALKKREGNEIRLWVKRAAFHDAFFSMGKQKTSFIFPFTIASIWKYSIFHIWVWNVSLSALLLKVCPPSQRYWAVLVRFFYCRRKTPKSNLG